MSNWNHCLTGLPRLPLNLFLYAINLTLDIEKPKITNYSLNTGRIFMRVANVKYVPTKVSFVIDAPFCVLKVIPMLSR